MGLEQRLQEAELRALLSNHSNTREHRDNSPQGDRSNTKLGEELGVEQLVQVEPGQLLEEHRGLGRGKPAGYQYHAGPTIHHQPSRFVCHP